VELPREREKSDDSMENRGNERREKRRGERERGLE